MTPTAALNEVLLQCAMRAERHNEIREADRRATELARRMDKLCEEQREGK